ncbi:MAG: chlorite dismutase family protein [Chloroflexi bacterium]|nr:chlorite dismutase family protein [Chloroflexota bacterium]
MSTDKQNAEVKGRRQVVKFSFYKVDPTWLAQPGEQQQLAKEEFCQAVESYGGTLRSRAYSLVGMRGDVDFLLWQIADRFDDVQALASALSGTSLGPYLSMPYSYLAMTRPSVYVSDKEAEERAAVHPSDSRYFFVYPFVKTRKWYQLSLDERQAMMNEHIRVGRKYPSVKLNTSYSFGMDDQEFVVAFETDEPSDFLDLVMELREAKTSVYTERDTPIFTCISMSLREVLDTIGSTQGVASTALEDNEGEWERVAKLAEVPLGGRKVVFHRGEQVALFHVDGEIYAIGNRCPHASGPLADGLVAGTEITCPSHESKFDLRTGQPLGGPSSRPATVFAVKVEAGIVYLAEARETTS